MGRAGAGRRFTRRTLTLQTRQTLTLQTRRALALAGVGLMLQPAAALAQQDDERREQLRAEMADALRRRQEILERMLAIGSGIGVPDSGLAAETGPPEFHRASRAKPLPEPPLDAFDPSLVAGPWPWTDELLLLSWTLDLDGDGRPEEIRYLQPDSKELLAREVDRNLDGRIDAWLRYRDQALFEQDVDDDHDGQPDARERYEADVVVWREIDRDGDGLTDVRRDYRDGWLAEEHFDPDHDGVSDMIVFYQRGEVQERHHDVDDDGEVDVVSIYGDGRLLRREVRSQDVKLDGLLPP